MLTQDRWNQVFREASARCESYGHQIVVTPHTLRHTFAVSMLQRLIAAVVSTTDMPALRAVPGAAQYRRMIADPLRMLQRMLGHASIDSTYIYLTQLDEAVELADLAVAAWAEDVDVPEIDS
jgi:integrase